MGATTFTLMQLGQKEAHWRVLIVEDHQDSADYLAAQLSRRGCELKVANDGTGAIKIAGSFQPHLILLDLVLRGMSGYEVARTIRDMGLKSRIVGITGMPRPRRRYRGRIDIDEFIVKPMLGAVIDALCEDIADEDARERSP